MNVLCIDFETYYDRDYSLKKMTTIEYIKHAKFQPIMMGWALNDEPVQIAIGYPRIVAVLNSIDWANTIVVAHNVQFDGAILKQRFNVEAAYYADTMAMMRATGGHIFHGASLDAVSKLLSEQGIDVPPKGTTIAKTVGMHLYDMYSARPYMALEPTQNAKEREEGNLLMWDYARYCMDDVLLARQAFRYFSKLLTPDEMQFQDVIAKCYIIPRTFISEEIVTAEIERIKQRDIDRTQHLADQYFGGDRTAMLATCRSAPKFTQFLREMGGELQEQFDPDVHRFPIPTRLSAKKGTVEPCYSKSYAPMMEMLEYPDEEVATIFRLKLNTTSSIELSRAERFLSIAKSGGGFGFPYVVSGAHTHRLSGGGSLNAQNLSSGRKEGQSNALKRSIQVPAGYKIIVADSSQIELRIGSLEANDTFTLGLFAQGKDPYSVQASQLYGGDPDEIKRAAKADIEPFKHQRQVAKSALLSCIYGTGAMGFQNYAKINGIDLTEDECVNIVKGYRDTHPEVVTMWNTIDRALQQMAAGGSGYFGGKNGNLFYFDGSRQVHGRTVAGIRLPDGMWINYYNLHKTTREYPDGSSKLNWAFTGMKEHRVQTVWTYAAKVFENLTQGLAFAVMKYQALQIAKRYPVILNTHDEWGIVVREEEAEEAQAYMQACMKISPPWLGDCPLDCEGSFADNYGDCK